MMAGNINNNDNFSFTSPEYAVCKQEFLEDPHAARQEGNRETL